MTHLLQEVFQFQQAQITWVLVATFKFQVVEAPQQPVVVLQLALLPVVTAETVGQSQ
jgi:hypothetical protein